ncbi:MULTISPECIES: M15 family metallopeptidase [unclassified Mesorhizobium]|uniref:M15 family metallopeptidase n=1 Tax=unclassified Mesorhizobium TaxID=325217 RepID=UPI000FD3A99E|nr:MULTISPECIES: M15 family metallopeptidase [unclassified Mesorhizobium]RUW97450.1 D-alanyl-D-alanine dipeptidase [Mesorhizobium sp. M8A.F.Ca.ET.059.01.1.1]TGR37629.1 D-alanyl-D-alanine dipeptidase [bacterium M00.F.Ca.ET.199.01.1.1]TGU22611.1 D-alanyl-D-alanine dipeptidase [bacterium M00.F.Ca.ET.156.01.1.1]TGV82820.1 D-alanyl-D-alanine dipeptidase [Mesorhizobium sp. M00.F.Ca.ET.149.01.1.1]TGR17713.1 D-alanyl-D-alanine dipeptidase [Mesorhizobium sp. M8A.F.Ca.ET.202.01.1.1]
MPGRAEGGVPRHTLRSIAAILAAFFAVTLPASADPLPTGFVRLAAIDASIRQDIRYSGADNFLHRKVSGYDAPVCILARQAALAVAGVQKAMVARGMTLIVFDCYRPARSVADMGDWTTAGGPPDPQWYPQVKRGDLIAEGYVARQSAHSRGSTVDIAIAPADSMSVPKPACGAVDANTLDFGTGFDCFDRTSETAHRPLGAEAAANRKLLVDAMRAGGFRNYAREWWHFTLDQEPFQKQRFDFPVTAE